MNTLEGMLVGSIVGGAIGAGLGGRYYGRWGAIRGGIAAGVLGGVLTGLAISANEVYNQPDVPGSDCMQMFYLAKAMARDYISHIPDALDSMAHAMESSISLNYQPF